MGFSFSYLYYNSLVIFSYYNNPVWNSKKTKHFLENIYFQDCKQINNYKQDRCLPTNIFDICIFDMQIPHMSKSQLTSSPTGPGGPTGPSSPYKLKWK